MVTIQRFRKFNTRDVYPGGRHDNDMCMTVKAGNRIFLRGQTGAELDGRTMHGTGFTVGDAAAQAYQAMKNIAVLLEEVGASLGDVCKIHTFILHRAHREAVYRAIGPHLRGVHPCGTGLIVDGFAMPEILVEVDVVAVVQG